jgi:hypothetical protein
MAKFDKSIFIGWDSEGINDGMIDEWTERQKLVLMSVSTGECIYRENGISLSERLRFIEEIAKKYPEAIHVYYGGSYDFNKTLEGLPREVFEELHTSKLWVKYNDEWIFRYRPRKELVIAKLKSGHIFRPNIPAKMQCSSYIRFWDVIGFFQKSFLASVNQWLGEDYPDYELIAAGKLARLNFNESDKEFMIRYNTAEVKALVEIMNRFHSALTKLDLKISRWDGAGALAGEIFKRYNLTDAFFENVDGKKIKIEIPAGADEACRYAYFGGRIESGFMGRYKGNVFNYDINSAYPFAANQLPDLNSGEWIHHNRITDEKFVLEMSSFSIFRVQYYFHEDRVYYPFPHRTLGGAVIFPKIGERWIYGPELKAAIHSLKRHDKLFIWEAWEFKPRGGISPFNVIGSLYSERQKLFLAKDPAEYPLKLGLNSIYGKLCQKLGWNEKDGTSPRFHFLFFAGWITSFTRARIYSAIAYDMDSVIAINTDGVVTTSPLPIKTNDNKEFGQWSLEMNDEIVQLQSGVYWLRKKDKWFEKARGLGRVVGEGINEKKRIQNRNEKIIERINAVENGWKNKETKIHFPVKLFITSKKALTGPDWFPRLGHWYIMHDAKTKTPGRGLELHCSGWGKRRLFAPIKSGRLTQTIAAENIEWSGKLGIDDPALRDLGEPYDLPWISHNEMMDIENDLDLSEV